MECGLLTPDERKPHSIPILLPTTCFLSIFLILLVQGSQHFGIAISAVLDAGLILMKKKRAIVRTETAN